MKIELERGDDITIGIEPIEQHRCIEVWRSMDDEEERAGVFVDGNTVWAGDLTKEEDPKQAVPDGVVKQRIALWDTLGASIIVEASTGIEYTNQVGGTACGHPVAEGWLLPLDRYNDYDDIFNITSDSWGDGALGRLSKGALHKLEAAIKELKLPGPDARTGKILLDHYRMNKTKNGEAWVPVLTTYGKGWLTWENSD